MSTARARARNLELEAAAFTNPDDADAWRVYADWLESVGDPRGELVSLSMHQRDAFLSQRKVLTAQIRERQQPFVEQWQAWARDRGISRVTPGFDRGFVRTIDGSLPELADHLDELFEREPIARLILRDVEGDAVMELCERTPAWTERLIYLKLDGEVGPVGAAGLAMLALPRLESLNLLGTELDAEACGHLANLDTLALASLTLTANEDLDDEGLGLLLESPTRSQWRQLYLSQTSIHADGLERLANTTELGGLEALYLLKIEAKFADFAVLLDSANLGGLKILELSSWGSWRARELRDRMRERLGAGLKMR